MEDYQKFLKDSKKYIKENFISNIKNKIPCVPTGGRWHPTGFAIFDIDFVHRLGTVRLHIWPRSWRERLKNHPPIHNHGFNLHSQVLAGQYREARFRILSLAEAGDGKNLNIKPLKSYVVKSDGKTNDDIIELSKEKMLAYSELGVEKYNAGVSHSLGVGEYHATLIPKNSYCATLAIMGPRQKGTVDRLLGRANFDPSQRTRVPITKRDSVSLIEQLFLEIEYASKI